MEPADRPRRRDCHPPARQRDGGRNARPRHLGPRSHRADPGVRGGEEHGGEAVHAAALLDVSPSRARPELRVLGQPGLLRREPAAVGGALVLREEQAERREAQDHRRDRARRAGDRDSGDGGQSGHQLGVLGSPRSAGATGSDLPRRAGRRWWRRTRRTGRQSAGRSVRVRMRWRRRGWRWRWRRVRRRRRRHTGSVRSARQLQRRARRRRQVGRDQAAARLGRPRSRPHGGAAQAAV